MKYDIAAIEAFLSRFAPYVGKNLLITPYGYNSSFGSLAAAASLTNQVQIAANGDFLLLSTRFRSVIGTTVGQTVSTLPIPFLRLLITDTGSGEQLTAQAPDIALYSGVLTGEDCPLPYPRIVAGRSSLSLQLTNYAPAAETYGSTEVFLEGLLIRAYQG